jgi:hypothetical protein
VTLYGLAKKERERRIKKNTRAGDVLPRKFNPGKESEIIRSSAAKHNTSVATLYYLQGHSAGARARSEAAYRLRTELGYTSRMIGVVFNRFYSTTGEPDHSIASLWIGLHLIRERNGGNSPYLDAGDKFYRTSLTTRTLARKLGAAVPRSINKGCEANPT